MLSFHGMPHRTLMLGDPYHCRCHETARLLADALGLTREQFTASPSQKPLWPGRWLEAYQATIGGPGQKGVRNRSGLLSRQLRRRRLETLEERSPWKSKALRRAASARYIPA